VTGAEGKQKTQLQNQGEVASQGASAIKSVSRDDEPDRRQDPEFPELGPSEAKDDLKASDV
jgi:hypothetical protein